LARMGRQRIGGQRAREVHASTFTEELVKKRGLCDHYAPLGLRAVFPKGERDGEILFRNVGFCPRGDAVLSPSFFFGGGRLSAAFTGRTMRKKRRFRAPLGRLGRLSGGNMAASRLLFHPPFGRAPKTGNSAVRAFNRPGRATTPAPRAGGGGPRGPSPATSFRSWSSAYGGGPLIWGGELRRDGGGGGLL